MVTLLQYNVISYLAAQLNCQITRSACFFLVPPNPKGKEKVLPKKKNLAWIKKRQHGSFYLFFFFLVYHKILCNIHILNKLSDIPVMLTPQIKKALRGVKVEVTHRGNMRRKYRISGLTTQATRELTYAILISFQRTFTMLLKLPCKRFIVLSPQFSC